MRFHIKKFTAIEIAQLAGADKIQYPIYQRTADVWDLEHRRLLIDSMLRGLDIPKLYYFDNQDGTYDCVDGHQRTQTIALFFENGFAMEDGKRFRDFKPRIRKRLTRYPFTVVLITKASDEDLRQLFLRLQLGVPTNSPERLKAIKSAMGDFVEKLVKTKFIQQTSVTRRRYGKLQLCAQICINSINRGETGEFTNAKYEDLRAFYVEHSDFDERSADAQRILGTLNTLNELFGQEASRFRNRANTVSAYLFVEGLVSKGSFPQKLVGGFFIDFLKELRREVARGIYANNEILLNYQTRVIQAADTKSAVTTRNEILEELYNHYKKHGTIEVKRIRE